MTRGAGRRRFLLTALAGLSGCGLWRPGDGPEVTEVRVFKSARRMELWGDGKRLHAFPVALGQNPVGHKQQRGDSRTPEGTYRIDRRNPNSAFHLSLGIDYPNAQDRARAAAAGVDPGGDIFIHGEGRHTRRGDWTDGCIAVTNAEMDLVYASVRTGTPVVIRA